MAFELPALPYDYEALQRLSWLGVSIAAGENACTAKHAGQRDTDERSLWHEGCHLSLSLVEPATYS